MSSFENSTPASGDERDLDWVMSRFVEEVPDGPDGDEPGHRRDGAAAGGAARPGRPGCRAGLGVGAHECLRSRRCVVRPP